MLMDRGLIEIDSPSLMDSAGFDQHIAALKVSGQKFSKKLHTSPEFFLKSVLAFEKECQERGVFYLGHVFRDDPKTDFHRKEFMMAEWYRPQFKLEDLKKDTLDMIGYFLPKLNVQHVNLFEHFQMNINNSKELEKYLKSKKYRFKAKAFEDLFSLLWIYEIEELLQNGINVVTGFPEKLKSMSKVDPKNKESCLRFEIAINGMEIANAYEEETDPKILSMKKSHMLYRALPKLGLMSGIALGIDRLLMSIHGHENIDDVMLPEQFP